MDIFVNTQTIQDSRCNVHLNTALVEGYLNALKDLSEKFDVPSNVTAETFLRIPDVFNVENTDEDTEKITQALCEALSVALKAYDAMRIAEGERLSEDLLTHLDFIDEATRKIETRSPQIVEDYRARLEAKVRELLQDNTADDGRILTETAIFADKINVNEETVRLKSHTSQFRKMLASGGSVGRKIDFLIQEMNREINTIGSKSQMVEINFEVVNMKLMADALQTPRVVSITRAAAFTHPRRNLTVL